MKTKKRPSPRRPKEVTAVSVEPRRMYEGHMRTEKEILLLDRLRAEAIQQRNDYLMNRKPSWL